MFRLGRTFSDDVLPPYTELVRFDAGPRLAGEELRDAPRRRCCAATLPRRPGEQPVRARSASSWRADLPRLLEGDAEDYHAYAFATVRMVGSAFEAGASHVEWVLGDDGAERGGRDAPDRRGLQGCSRSGSRAGARSIPSPALAGLAQAWEDTWRRSRAR